MNFGDIYALVLKEYPDILTVDEMSKARCQHKNRLSITP